MKVRFFLILLIAVSMVVLMGFMPSTTRGASSFEERSGAGQSESTKSADKLAGMCYGPHRDNENPDAGIQPTEDELSQDIDLIKNLTHSIRTYGVTDGLEQIPVLCQQHGIDCYPGAWISRYTCENERQINGLIQVAKLNLNNVKGLTIGSEVILRNDMPEQELIQLINRVKDSTDLPVAAGETWSGWLEHPELAQAVDIMFVHIYAYWDGIAIEDAAAYVLEKWNELRLQYPDKTMIIGETGWPSQGSIRGDAIPSEENQRMYLSDFVSMAENHNIEYYYFEIFDEKWKSQQGEGDVGGHWGLYYSDGSLKPLLTDLVPEQAQEGIMRPPRAVYPTEAALPLYVYSDGCDSRNGFYPSGWMGELGQQADSLSGDPTEILDELSIENPYSGETCIRISYTPSPGQWGGIYWQFPLNNWGAYPGYDFSNSIGEGDSVTLTFCARGENGGERAEFKTGGINNPYLEYKDSYGPIPTGVITLNKEWQEFSLNLTGRDLSMVLGGFVWVTNYYQNPEGATIYVDEILLDVKSPTGVGEIEDAIPAGYSLSQNRPNPFNLSTSIKYSLPERSQVKLAVFNILGQMVTTLVDEDQPPGAYNASWNGADWCGRPASSGVYFYRLIAGNFTKTRKMVLLK